jgi:hypothetical protein
LERIDEQPRGTGRTALVIVRQFQRSFPRIELNLNPLALAVGHAGLSDSSATQVSTGLSFRQE